MKKRPHGAGIRATVFLLTTGVVSLYAQPQFPGAPYAKGQDVSPTFEGWESGPGASYTLYFGYYNRNSEEEIDVPLGPDNTFDLGNGDQGQPTHFYPRRRWFVFKVVVPADWPKDKRVVWTLTTKGKTNQAKGWLQPEWEVDQMLISRNAGADPFLRASNSNITPGNKAPVVTGSSAQTIALPAAAALTATASDDGIPSSEVGGGRPPGVQIRWILYRGPTQGPTQVQFDPGLSPVVYGKPVTLETKVTFSMPGSYRLRAIATDGWGFSTYDVDVKVNPGTSAAR
jgi:hypothetical protein